MVLTSWPQPRRTLLRYQESPECLGACCAAYAREQHYMLFLHMCELWPVPVVIHGSTIAGPMLAAIREEISDAAVFMPA